MWKLLFDRYLIKKISEALLRMNTPAVPAAGNPAKAG